MTKPLVLVADFELPPVIVRDALVDPDLAVGWVGANLDSEPVEFELEAIEGGLRGWSTRLRVTVTVSGGTDVGELRALWLDRLDALDELLHGHPRH
ncbi:MAG: hypothetical protein ACKVOG_10630 [Rhodoglobus sp.]